MKPDLYRVFFPIGWLLGVWGAFVWLLYYFDLIAYPGSLHPEIMMGGFILSFVLGFLGTAAPKFTNSYPPTTGEMAVAFALSLILFISQFLTNELVFKFSSLSIFIFLIYFLIKRFINRKANPPAPFLFVGFGVLTGTLGSILLILSAFNIGNEETYSLGRLFFYQAFILSFVLGIGSRLIPSLLGFSPAPNMAQKELSVKNYAVMGIFFLSTYLIEVYVLKILGILLRDLIILFIAFYSWKIYLLPKRKAIHAFGLWLSCLFMVFGYVAAGFFEAYYIHFMHLFYVSGLSLMTILVASRVALSHGGHDMMIELKSKTLLVVVVLFASAGVLRMCAGLIPDYYLSHLFYASCLWLSGMVVWGIAFLPKIYKIHLK